MSVGEPAAPAAGAADRGVLAGGAAREWNRYPAMAGTPELRQSIVDWLTRRYHLADGALACDRHILTLAGTKEGLYLLASLVVPRDKAGQTPVVLVPNPYYLVYNGARPDGRGRARCFLDATPRQRLPARPRGGSRVATLPNPHRADVSVLRPPTPAGYDRRSRLSETGDHAGAAP